MGYTTEHKLSVTPSTPIFYSVAQYFFNCMKNMKSVELHKVATQIDHYYHHHF